MVLKNYRMNSREQILEAVLKNQPSSTALPEISMLRGDSNDVIDKYVTVFKSIGGDAIVVGDLAEIGAWVENNYDYPVRIVTSLPEFEGDFELIAPGADPHSYEDVELAIIKAHFGVAENGAVWLTEDLMGVRIIPYICQHLIVIIEAASIVPTLHEAYEKIGKGDYGFSGFIGGPSKTADIEQALVLGAHGPLSMLVFIIGG
jgi:L-lactate dehydrogenase complex protein LldG